MTSSAPALSHEALTALVQAFYARVRADDVLGAMFNTAIPSGDWPTHLARMADFWSSVMLTSGRYHGNPLAAHLKHRDAITRAMFERWLELWVQNADEMLPSKDAKAVVAKAQDRSAWRLQAGADAPPAASISAHLKTPKAPLGGSSFGLFAGPMMDPSAGQNIEGQGPAHRL